MEERKSEEEEGGLEKERVGGEFILPEENINYSVMQSD